MLKWRNGAIKLPAVKAGAPEIFLKPYNPAEQEARIAAALG